MYLPPNSQTPTPSDSQLRSRVAELSGIKSDRPEQPLSYESIDIIAKASSAGLNQVEERWPSYGSTFGRVTALVATHSGERHRSTSLQQRLSLGHRAAIADEASPRHPILDPRPSG